MVGMSEYELARLANIERNNEHLKSLNLSTLRSSSRQFNKLSKRKSTASSSSNAPPLRMSKRLRIANTDGVEDTTLIDGYNDDKPMITREVIDSENDKKLEISEYLEEKIEYVNMIKLISESVGVNMTVAALCCCGVVQCVVPGGTLTCAVGIWSAFCCLLCAFAAAHSASCTLWAKMDGPDC